MTIGVSQIIFFFFLERLEKFLKNNVVDVFLHNKHQ